MKKQKKILSWLYVILWCGIIFFFSSIPYLRIEELGFWDFILRKISHITEYAVLSILLVNALFVSICFKKSNIYLLSFVLGVLYAISDEIHQYFVPGRFFSIVDILIDSIGVTIGIVLWDRFLRFKFYKNTKNLEK
ncbi:MAG: VanZ family protein [Candidatus Anstonellales archaeon]